MSRLFEVVYEPVSTPTLGQACSSAQRLGRPFVFYNGALYHASTGEPVAYGPFVPAGDSDAPDSPPMHAVEVVDDGEFATVRLDGREVRGLMGYDVTRHRDAYPAVTLRIQAAGVNRKKSVEDLLGEAIKQRDAQIGDLRKMGGPTARGDR